MHPFLLRVLFPSRFAQTSKQESNKLRKLRKSFATFIEEGESSASSAY